MGEAGIQPSEFWQLQWWEVRSIIRGYARRNREQWSMTRWHAFNIMCAMPYCDMRKDGIFKASDLITFPWERPAHAVTAQDADDAAELLRREKERMATMNPDKGQPTRR